MLIDTHTHMYPPSHLAAMQKTATEWQVGQMGGRRVLLKGEVPVVALTEAVESGTAAQGDGRPRGRHGGPVADLPECQFVGPQDGLLLAQATNNDFAALHQERYPDRFIGLAAVPLKDRSSMRRNQ